MRLDNQAASCTAVASKEMMCLPAAFSSPHPGPQFANQLDQLLEQVDSQGSQVCATEQIEVGAHHLVMHVMQFAAFP